GFPPPGQQLPVTGRRHSTDPSITVFLGATAQQRQVEQTFDCATPTFGDGIPLSDLGKLGTLLRILAHERLNGRASAPRIRIVQSRLSKKTQQHGESSAASGSLAKGAKQRTARLVASRDMSRRDIRRANSV